MFRRRRSPNGNSGRAHSPIRGSSALRRPPRWWRRSRCCATSTASPILQIDMERAGAFARLARIWDHAEDGLAVAAFLGMGFLPVLELVLRAAFGTGIPGSFGYVQHLTLWVAFLGALIASRARRHITLFH